LSIERLRFALNRCKRLLVVLTTRQLKEFEQMVGLIPGGGQWRDQVFQRPLLPPQRLRLFWVIPDSRVL
jgi:hypothetical protein